MIDLHTQHLTARCLHQLCTSGSLPQSWNSLKSSRSQWLSVSHPFALQEWQKLNYDIYTLRQTRKEVRSRWKHILEDLGKLEAKGMGFQWY